MPAVVAMLFFMPGLDLGTDVSMLPGLNAVINGTVSVLLIAGYIDPLREKTSPRAAMLSAFFCLPYF